MNDIVQINLHKSMLAMVELNRHVKYAYNTDNVRTRADGGVAGPGGDVNVEEGRSSIRIYRNIDINRKNVRIGAVDGDGDGPGEVDVEGGSNIRIYRNHNDNGRRNRSKNKNGHNISRRGDIMHSIHVDTMIWMGSTRLPSPTGVTE